VTQQPEDRYRPSRRERLRPMEYVGGAAIAAIFVGLITLMVTRDWTLTLIGAGGVFIIVLVVLALLQMAIKPDATERAELAENPGTVTPPAASDDPVDPVDPADPGNPPAPPADRGH
jgi:predicted lysophospholipase L1 biosynthesis ABC-type transport system permease subunit